MSVGERVSEDLVLAPESGSDDGEAAQSETPDDERDGRAWHAAEEAAHIPHVLRIEGVTLAVLVPVACFVMSVFHPMNHAAGAMNRSALKNA